MKIDIQYILKDIRNSNIRSNNPDAIIDDFVSLKNKAILVIDELVEVHKVNETLAKEVKTLNNEQISLLESIRQIEKERDELNRKFGDDPTKYDLRNG